MTVFDLSGLHLGQLIDPIKTMVLAGSGRDLQAAYVDGVAVMQAFALRGADEWALAVERGARLREGDRSAPGACRRHAAACADVTPAVPVELSEGR